MSTPVFSVTVPNGTTYNIERASAVNQKSLLMLIGARITIAANRSPLMGTTEALIGMLMSLGESDFDKVASLVLRKVVKSGGAELVTIDSFQGDMMSYLHITAEAVRENLSDFFTWLQVQSKTDAPTQPASRTLTP
jgi:hypothetical protein